MKKINDEKLLDYYFNKYSLDQLFSNNVKYHMELFSYNRQEYICTSGEDMNYIFFFVKGTAKVYYTLSNGKSLLLCFYNPLMILGDLELLNPKINPINVQALELCHCIGIKMDYTKKFLINDIKFMTYINYSLSNKLDRSSINNAINLLCKLENRLASYIISTYVDAVVSGETVDIFDENLTNVAELLGTSYRHLLRTLSTFCKENILKKHNNFYEIINMASLRNLATDLYK